MNTLNLLILPLMLASIACMETVSTIKPLPTQVKAMLPTEIESGAVFEVSVWTPSPTPPPICALVIADISLHVRNAPNVHGAIVGYLSAGELVRLGAQPNPEWWEVTTSDGTRGYSHEAYLGVYQCNQP